MTATLRGVTGTRSVTTEAAAERYLGVRRRTESLAEPLSAEDQTVQSMPDVSPTKWHRAHVTWFFEAFLLERFVPGYEAYDPGFGFLFNSYYEALGERYPRPARGLVSRPGVVEIGRYRHHVDEQVLRLLEAPPSGVLPAEAAALLELGCHHEEQHQELLLMDAKHVLSQSPLDPAYLVASPPDGRATQGRVTQGRVTQGQSGGRAGGWARHEGGEVAVGHGGDGFAFDNEGPRHTVRLAPFELAETLVSCGEWLAFMAEGGYARPELWLSDGWATVQREGWRAPLYWREEPGGAWSLFTLSGRRPVAEDEPVCHVSYYEADAFARWAGARLPVEHEWEALAAASPVEGNFLESGRLHPGPASGPSRYGDAWVWTGSAYLPYPRFRPAPGAVGEYNGKFMVNQHVLRGGSCVTPAGHVRATYRNFFPPAARWPFTGVRLARDVPEAS